jgi:hypothetical protein
MWIFTYCRRNQNNGLTYRKQQAATIQISKERIEIRRILSGQVDDALVRCKKNLKN